VSIEESYVCPRCGNGDPRYLGLKGGKPYCRKCISFLGAEASGLPSSPKPAPLNLHYSLSQEQRGLSERILQNFDRGVDTLVYAVCGAGKTELVYGVIAFAIAQGLKVGFALPRRDIVIELFWRLKEAFPHNKVVAVYGEHTFALEGDVVLLTTHQLYRYPRYFDLLVMDEIDAFPFKGNAVLTAMFLRSLKGHFVMMSATPNPETILEFRKPGRDILELRTRFHKKPIPLPRIVLLPKFLQPLHIIRKLRNYALEKKPCFVFTPSIAESEELFQTVSFLAKEGDFVNSTLANREDSIASFKEGKLRYLVTTSVLERGVTIKNLQVLVYHSDDERIYDSAALIQMAGRVGRKSEAPDGEVIFLGEKKTKAMESALKEIRFCNGFL
jgi:competence protein ComFA